MTKTTLDTAPALGGVTWRARRPACCAWATALLLCGRPATALPAEEQGMLRIHAGDFSVGTAESERVELARRFDCHPTWLGDDLPKRQTALSAFWLDKYPTTNGQYRAFVEATGHQPPLSWARWGGVFPREYRDHPVVGVTGKDAAAYASWAGKRLPSAEEWEAAMTDPTPALFAWGDAWPGPLQLRREARISWDLPGTRKVGTGECGRSASGIEDFAGQVLEWVSNVVPHHGVQFQLLKGASWFHEDPVNFRVAAGWYAYEGWRSAFTGFRCALNGDKRPRSVPSSASPDALSAEEAAKRLETAPVAGPPVLSAGGGASRSVSVAVPCFGPYRVAISAPETITWNGASVLTWRNTPDLKWTLRSAERAVYEMKFDDLHVSAEFLAREDMVEQRFTAVNRSGKEGTFRTSSCFNLQSHAMFYDCEQLRTYALDAQSRFVPLRRLSRGGDCVRWITGPRARELGDNLRWAVLAVVSRDGRGVIASGRSGQASDFSVATNTLFTCLHTDATARVAAQSKVTTRQIFWFLPGNLGDLAKRYAKDLTGTSDELP